jgi:hypothetical protein
VLGGVPRRGIFDNMRTAVDRIGTGKARQVKARFAAMASHYLFELEFCNPASGWESRRPCPKGMTARSRRTSKMHAAGCGIEKRRSKRPLRRFISSELPEPPAPAASRHGRTRRRSAAVGLRQS